MLMTIRLFAMLGEQLGATIELELPSKVSPDLIKELLIDRYPAVKAIIQDSRLAINQQFVAAKETHKLLVTDEIAVIPPVSGG
jgi:molybdopterin converting factor small subunit